MINIIMYFTGKVKKWRREKNDRDKPELIERSKLKKIGSVNEVHGNMGVSWKEWWLEFENGRQLVAKGESYKIGAYYNIFKNCDGSYHVKEEIQGTPGQLGPQELSVQECSD